MRIREDKAICLSLSVVSFACVLAWCIVIACMGCDRLHERNDDQLEGGSMVIVHWYTAEWCSACKQQEPQINEILKEVWYSKFDLSKWSSLAEQRDVSVVPTYVVTVDGKEIGRAYNPHELRELLGGLK